MAMTNPAMDVSTVDGQPPLSKANSKMEILSNQPAPKGISFFWIRTHLVEILALLLAVVLIAFVVMVVLYAKEKNSNDDVASVSSPGSPSTEKYQYSDESAHVGLKTFLKKVQTTYFEYNRDNLAWQPGKTDEELDEEVRERHLPYNADPSYLKAKTDAAFSLLDEIKAMKMDENKMKPREVKAVEQVKHFLLTVFGNPYDENFYNGDWMLGPNHFCWQPICSIAYSINAHAYHAKPGNLDHLDTVLKTILMNKKTISQYKLNLKLGIRTGMVQSIFTCKSGLNAFKQEFKQISKENNPNDVLKEWFVKYYIHENFIKGVTDDDRKKWNDKHKKDIATSINETLIKGIGEPIVGLINYLANEHLPHCLPMDLASGLGNLPVDYIYLNGNRTANRTTKTLPITNKVISGKESYKNILPYFTTSDITPERINEIGEQRLKVLYPQVLAIAKNITGESNETAAVIEFRRILKQQKNFYNNAPFPQQESNETAYKLCTDPETAEKNCPKRWAALLEWANTCRQTMGMFAPKLIPLFYHTGKKITMPNCPIEMLPSFNPSSGAQFFRRAGSKCTKPAYFGLPFFLENFGPRFSEWSVTAHEGWPGHHTQIQAQAEYFKDKYGGVPKWLDEQTYYTFFTEGWGLYAENPVIAKDTDTYKNHPFQKYGMLKWQEIFLTTLESFLCLVSSWLEHNDLNAKETFLSVPVLRKIFLSGIRPSEKFVIANYGKVWRALRLIVDTGLHYRGMNRSTALWYFSKYAWDDTDLAQKEITRYQGTPGQATAYMLGQQKLVQLRNDAKSRLTGIFSIQDFHYQVLSQGSAPEAYLAKHVEKYIKCTLKELKGEQCDIILKTPPKSAQSLVGETIEREGPPKPPRRHYL